MCTRIPAEESDPREVFAYCARCGARLYGFDLVGKLLTAVCRSCGEPWSRTIGW